MKNKKTIYLISVMICFVLGSIIHSTIKDVLSTLGVFKYYLGLLMMLIPTLLFFYYIKYKIRSDKRYLGYFLGFLTGVLIVIIFGLFRLSDPSNVYRNIPIILYWIIVFIPTAIMLFYPIKSLITHTSSFKENLYLFIYVLSFTIFMISTIKGFYVGSSVYSFTSQILNIKVLFHYATNNSINYALTFITFLASVYFRYRYLDVNEEYLI